MQLEGKVVVITGASMGIGEALAKEFAEFGASVVLTSRDAARSEAARKRIGHLQRTLAVACDVRHREDIDRLLSLTLHNFGRVDVWINNAGHGLLDSVAGMDMAACRAMFDTNLFGAVEGMQAVIPVMRRQGVGTIINVSSVAGHIPLAYSAAYSASKFAMNALGKAARVELLGSGVHVMTACPGYIATEFSQRAIRGRERRRVSSKVNRGISAQRCARAILNGYLKGKREVVVPWWDHLVIKLYQCFPAMVEWGMARLMRPVDQIVAEAAEVKEEP
jgi:short-subunit dehydrogenase